MIVVSILVYLPVDRAVAEHVFVHEFKIPAGFEVIIIKGLNFVNNFDEVHQD